MSNIMIYDIVGTGDFVVPEGNDVALVTEGDISDLLDTDPGVAGLAFDNVKAWVLDSQTGAGVEGARSLACLISGFTYNFEVCPSEAEIDTLIAALRVALLTVPEGGIGQILSVGVIEFNIFNAGVPPVD